VSGRFEMSALAQQPAGKRGTETRRRISAAARRRFAQRGFRGTRLADIAADVGITRAALLKHFGSKDDLFFEVHREAVLGLPSYLDAPPEVLDRGFYETFRYWLDNSDHLVNDDFEKYRVELLGKYSTELSMQDRINRFWLLEDPEKTIDFVDFGKVRGEIRAELDPHLVAALLDWIEDGMQRSMVVEELDRGLFHRRNDYLERRRKAVDTIIALLRRALAPDRGTDPLDEHSGRVTSG
jgi:AcrR family transcriptional regulator